MLRPIAAFSASEASQYLYFAVTIHSPPHSTDRLEVYKYLILYFVESVSICSSDGSPAAYKAASSTK